MQFWSRTAAAVLVLSQALAANAQARPQRTNRPAQPQAGHTALPPPRPALHATLLAARPQVGRNQVAHRQTGRDQGVRQQTTQPRPRRDRAAAVRTAAPPPRAEPPEPVELRRARVAEEVRAAAHSLGFDPTILLAIVMAESSLREHVRNPRSSAAGPLQFSAGTWLAAVPAFADRIPELAPHAQRMEALADRERRLDRMQASPRQRRAMLVLLRREQEAARRSSLALRHDTRIAARVGAALAQEDAERFRSLTGERLSGPADVYAVHLLGVGTAAELARAARQRPAASVAEVLPRPVLNANPEIFLGPGDAVISVLQARQRIAARIEPPAQAGPVQVVEAP